MKTNCVGANLSRLRVDRGFTQAALAEKVGVSRSLVGRTERGRVVPRTETLLAFARTLGTTYRDLVSPVRPLASVRFRTGARMRNREQVLAEASRWLDDYRRLEDKMNDGPRSASKRRGGARRPRRRRRAPPGKRSVSCPTRPS